MYLKYKKWNQAFVQYDMILIAAKKISVCMPVSITQVKGQSQLVPQELAGLNVLLMDTTARQMLAFDLRFHLVL